MKQFEIQKFLKELNKNSFVISCGIPMGYKATYPLIEKNNSKIFLTIPYRKMKKSNIPGIQGILPIEYVVKFELHKVSDAPDKYAKAVKNPEGYVSVTPAGFSILRYCDKFKSLPFGKVVETFPNEAIKQIGKDEYKEKITKLYDAYDVIINDLLGISKASGIDKVEFKQLLSFFVEPSLKESYKLLSESFVNQYFQD